MVPRLFLIGCTSNIVPCCGCGHNSAHIARGEHYATSCEPTLLCEVNTPRIGSIIKAISTMSVSFRSSTQITFSPVHEAPSVYSVDLVPDERLDALLPHPKHVPSGSVAYPGGFSGCPETPPPATMFFLFRGVTPLLAPTLTSHLHLRLLETPLDTNSGYATAAHVCSFSHHSAIVMANFPVARTRRIAADAPDLPSLPELPGV